MVKRRILLIVFGLLLVGIFVGTPFVRAGIDNVPICAAQEDEYNPSIAVKDSNVYAVWQRGGEFNGDIYFAKSIEWGKNWECHEPIGEGSEPSIAVDQNGFIYVVWDSGTFWKSTIYISKSTDGGSSFSTPVKIGSGGDPDLAVDSNGYLYAVWQNGTSIDFAKSKDRGANWSFTVVGTTTSGYSDPPKLAVSPSGNNVYVVWKCPPSLGAYVRVYFSRSTDGGSTFSPRKNPTGFIRHGEYNPDIAAYGENEIYIVWVLDQYENNHIYFAKSTDSGVVFSSNIRVNDGDYSTTDAYLPSIAADDGGIIYIAWVDNRGGDKDIHFDKSTDGGSSFGVDIRVDNTTDSSYQTDPSIAVGNDKRVIIAWEDKRNDNYDIYCAELTVIQETKKLFPGNRSLYVWCNAVDGGVGVISDTVNRTKLFEFCKSKRIKIIFLNSAGVVHGEIDGNPIDKNNYTTFIDEAHNLDIKVFGLQGCATWALPENMEEGWNYTQAVIAYGKFDGIMDDTEPYINAGWWDNVTERAQWYLDWLHGIRDIIKNSSNPDLPFWEDIPFWYDKNEYTANLILDNSSVARPLNEYVSDIIDLVNIMDYRDFAEGVDGIIVHAQGEVEYGPTVISVETQCLELDKLSFCEEKERYMEYELNKVYNHFVDNHNFKGFSIHYYGTYRVIAEIPIASFIYFPEYSFVNQTIMFNASRSYDQDGYITEYEWNFGDGNKGTGKIINHSYSLAGNYNVTLTVTDNNDTINSITVVVTVYPQTAIFDTGEGIYPSIMGTHYGTITLSHDVYASKMYTYPCSGTGGHTEYVRFENESWNITANWDGYKGDWHNITFDKPFTLYAGLTYNYTIRTGSYPQIHHTDRLETDDGFVTCDSFLDANGRKYGDWIPAIILE